MDPFGQDTLIIGPNETDTLVVRYMPVSAGEKSIQLAFSTNSEDDPAVSIGIASEAETVPISFSSQIQPIFNNSCTGCHGSNGGLDLAAGSSFGNLVNVQSQGYAGLRVASGDPAASVLWNKIENTGTYGGQMPPSGGLSESDRDLIQIWITEGALDN